MKAKRFGRHLPCSHLQVSMLLLCIVVLLIAASLLIVDHHCNTLQARITQVITADAENGQAEVIAAVQEAQMQWEQSRGWLQLVVPRQSVADVNTAMAKLLPLAEVENDELIAECTALRAMLQWMCEQY